MVSRAREGIERPGREAVDGRRHDLVARRVVERRGERRPVERVVDRPPQPRVAEERAVGVQDDVVEERARREEVALAAPSRGRAPRPVAIRRARCGAGAASRRRSRAAGSRASRGRRAPPRAAWGRRACRRSAPTAAAASPP